jgi:flagellar biosynthesis/type III secretory pathway protein FliH
VLCEWGEELKGLADHEETAPELGPPDRKEFFGIVFQQVRHEGYIEGFQEGQAKGREQSKKQIDKLRAEIEKLKTAETKAEQKQEALF